MRARFIPLVLLLAACGTQRPLCPTDSTADIDATITQINTPVVSGTSDGSEKPTNVAYAITIQNRTNEPVHIQQIMLAPPHILGGYSAIQQCLGLDRMGADLEVASRGFDRTIAAHQSAAFEMWTRQEVANPNLILETAKAVTMFIRVDSPGGTRSEKLTRKVTFKLAGSGVTS